MRSNEHAIQCQWQKVVPYAMISKDTAQYPFYIIIYFIGEQQFK